MAMMDLELYLHQIINGDDADEIELTGTKIVKNAN